MKPLSPRVDPVDSSASLADAASRIARVLQAKDGIREASVLRAERAGWIGFVVADDKYLDGAMERAQAAQSALNRWRKSFDLTHFTAGALSKPVGLNIQGWNSSYTLQELPEDEMLEWVQLTVSRILGFEPKAAYEIGCGTGMLMLRVAPTCQRYVAVDFSPATLDRVRTQLTSFPTLETSIELLERMADDFSGFDQNSFDTVVLNSVAQFFPNSSYLTRVLEGAIDIVRPGGRIFAGDMQNLPLRKLFLSSVELFRSDEGQPLSDVADRVLRRMRLEPWLYVSPAYFLHLAATHRKVSRVDIEPRPGNADNEVTRYRYNAILHVGEPYGPRSEIPFEDWREHQWRLEEIKELIRTQAGPFGIKCIPNSRVTLDDDAFEEIRRADVSMTVRDLKRKLDQLPTHGIHPQQLVDLAKGEGEIKLSWAACRHDGSYDAVFFPAHSRGSSLHAQAINWPQPDRTEYLTLTSRPGQSSFLSDFVRQITDSCRNNLPPELAPAAVHLVDTLPEEMDQASLAQLIDGLDGL
jgi:SAM-dependent methyltransferase